MKDIKTMMREAGEATKGDWEVEQRYQKLRYRIQEDPYYAAGKFYTIWGPSDEELDHPDDGVGIAGDNPQRYLSPEDATHIANMDPPTTLAWGAALVEVMEWVNQYDRKPITSSETGCEGLAWRDAAHDLRAILSAYGLRLGGDHD